MNPADNSQATWKRADTDWLRDCGWGVFTHYLVKPETTADEWNRQVDSFDTRRLADQLADVGARYYFITLGQGSGHYCAPNAAYDRHVRIEPSKCSRRDLVSDLYDALAPKGVRLLAYIPSDPSWADPTAWQRLGWQPGPAEKRTDKRLKEFQLRFEEVVREWSLRWGPKVSGWWVDGCYFADDMYRHPERPNFRSFTEAMKAGNPGALVAFNTGVRVPVTCATEYEDYTAGELAGDLPVGGWGLGDNPAFCHFGAVGRWVDGAQYHVLNFLGPWWGQPPPRFPTELVAGYTRYIIEHEGVVTWDVPIEPDGRIPEDFLEQLRAIGQVAGKRESVDAYGDACGGRFHP